MHSAEEVLAFWAVPAVVSDGSREAHPSESESDLSGVVRQTLAVPRWFQMVPDSQTRQKYGFRLRGPYILGGSGGGCSWFQ